MQLSRTGKKWISVIVTIRPVFPDPVTIKHAYVYHCISLWSLGQVDAYKRINKVVMSSTKDIMMIECRYSHCCDVNALCYVYFTREEMN